MPYRRRRQLWISRSNEASANSSREQQVRWAIILDWPGLEYQSRISSVSSKDHEERNQRVY